MPTIKTTTSYKDAIENVIDNETRVVYIAPTNEHAITYATFMYEHNRESGKYEKYNKCEFLRENVVIIINPQDLPKKGTNPGLFAASYLCRNVRNTYSYPYGTKAITDEIAMNYVDEAIKETELKNTFSSKKELKNIWAEVAFHCSWICPMTDEMTSARENYRKQQIAKLDEMKQEYHNMVAKAIKAFEDDVEVDCFHRLKSWSGSLTDEWMGIIYEKGQSGTDGEVASRMKIEVCQVRATREVYIRYSSTYMSSSDCTIKNPTVEKLVNVISAVKNFVQVARACEK